MNESWRARRSLFTITERMETDWLPQTTLEEEVTMYLTDIVWVGYALWITALAVFMLVFTAKIRQKGG